MEGQIQVDQVVTVVFVVVTVIMISNTSLIF